MQGKHADMMQGQGLGEGWQVVFQETDAAAPSATWCLQQGCAKVCEVQGKGADLLRGY